MASTQVLSYLSTPAYYVTYNAANRLYQENCSGVRSVFSMWTRSSARLLMQKFVTANAFQQLLVLLLLPEAGGRVDDFDEWLESKKHRRCSLQTSFRHVRGHFLRWTFIFAFSPTDVNNVSGFGKLQPRWRYPQTHVFISVRGINDERKLEYLSLRSDWIDVILFNVIFRKAQTNTGITMMVKRDRKSRLQPSTEKLSRKSLWRDSFCLAGCIFY